MAQSFVIYGGMIIIMILLFNLSNRKKRLTGNRDFLNTEMLIAILTFSFFAGARYDVGVDYLAYLESYLELNKYGRLELENVEFGFGLILKFFSLFNAHFFWVFFLFGLLQIGFLLYAFKKEKYLYPYLAFVLMTTGIFFNFMNEIRQSIVVCVFLFALNFVFEKKIRYYFLLCFLSYFIHKSALMFVLIYFLLIIKKDLFTNIYLQLLIVAMAIFLGNIQIWNYAMSLIEYAINVSGYSERYGDIRSKMTIWERSYSKGLRYYAPLLMNVLIILNSVKLKKYFNSLKFNRLYNLYFLGVLFGILFYDNTILQRPARFFTIFQLIFTAYFLFYLYQNLKRSLFNLITFAVIIILSIGILYAFVQSDHHTMYYFYWEKIYAIA